jgi:hypothetical protein
MRSMNPLPPNTGVLPPVPRALALSPLMETVVPRLSDSREASAAAPSPREADAENRAELWRALRSKCGELSVLVLRADDPAEAARYVLGYLPEHLDYVFELVRGPKPRLALGECEVLPRDAPEGRWFKYER